MTKRALAPRSHKRSHKKKDQISPHREPFLCTKSQKCTFHFGTIPNEPIGTRESKTYTQKTNFVAVIQS
jgi:hypothetical protein